MKKYDVIIVGAGPAGLLAAFELENHKNVLLIEKGDSIDKLVCPIQNRCLHCHVCTNICGVGGAGGRSDGKLASGEVGINKDLIGKCYFEEIEEVLGVFSSFCELPIPSQSIKRSASKTGAIEQEAVPIYHLGTTYIRQLFQKIYDNLTCDKLLNCAVGSFSIKNGCFYVQTEGEQYCSKYLIIATGKGDLTLSSSYDKFKIKRCGALASIGVRLEVPISGLNYMKEKSHNLKIKKDYGNAYVKTHCFCFAGELVPYRAQSYTLVGGCSDPLRYTLNSNVNILYRFKDESNFTFVLKQLKHFEEKSHGNILYQSIDDFLNKNLSRENFISPQRWEAPGDISRLFDKSIYNSIRDFLIGTNDIGIIDLRGGLVHAPAAEWIIPKFVVNSNFETEICNLFVIGDGSGMTQGIISAAISGKRAAKRIIIGRESE